MDERKVLYARTTAGLGRWRTLGIGPASRFGDRATVRALSPSVARMIVGAALVEGLAGSSGSRLGQLGPPTVVDSRHEIEALPRRSPSGDATALANVGDILR
jgi:hypothetical protein